MVYQIHYVLGLVHISNLFYCHFTSKNSDFTVLQIHLAVSNLCVLYILFFLFEIPTPFAIWRIFLRNCMSVKLFLALLLLGTINHSLLCSTSVPHILVQMLLVHYFKFSWPSYASPWFLWQFLWKCCPLSCRYSLTIPCLRPVHFYLSLFSIHISVDSLLGGEVAWDTSGDLLSVHA